MLGVGKRQVAPREKSTKKRLQPPRNGSLLLGAVKFAGKKTKRSRRTSDDRRAFGELSTEIWSPYSRRGPEQGID